ncbi:MAG TPA: hypothetical protein VGT44_21780 [Ktedonobacteraceae bacterium]|nr:hypothetical protein [Ktedonobacteraceae bacterium]
MNINEQLEHLLANLGVQMEYSEDEQRGDKSEVPGERDSHHLDEIAGAEPEISIFQSSRDHYGVFYRLDIIESMPQLRIMVPVEHGALKMEMYLVRLNSQATLHNPFASIVAYHGSTAFERSREASLQHLLYAAAEMMKQLFWAGDLDSMTFPPEIEVRRLV